MTTQDNKVNGAHVQLDIKTHLNTNEQSLMQNGQKSLSDLTSQATIKQKLNGQINLAQTSQAIETYADESAYEEPQAEEAQPAAEEAQAAEAAPAEAPAAEAPAAEAAPAEEEAPAPPPPKKKKIAVKKAAKKKISIKKKAVEPPVEEAQPEAPAAEAPAAEAPPADASTAQVSAEQMAQAEAQAQAEAEAQVAAQQEAEQAPAPKKGGKAKPVINTKEANEAAAVAAAADKFLQSEKPWSKMTEAEKAAKRAKDEEEKQAKAEKEARENPTVDENGEHIMTVAEAKAQAAELQNTLVAGEQAVEEKIRLEQERLANEPATPAEPVKQEEDDGHIETVEEAKAKMEAAQKAMEDGIAATDHKIEQQNVQEANMPNFGALADLHGSLSNMSNSRKKKQVNDMCAKLNIQPEPSDYKLEASDLTETLIGRAKEAGMSEHQINEALAE